MTTPIPAVPTWANGDTPTGTQLTALCNSLAFWTDPPACSVFRNAAQSSPHATWTFLQWDGQMVDAAESMHSVSYANSKVFIHTTGRYQISGQLTYLSNATGVRGAQVRSNSFGDVTQGASLFIGWQSANAAASGVTSIPIPPMIRQLNAGDHLETWGYQSSGGSLGWLVGTTSSTTYFTARLIAS